TVTAATELARGRHARFIDPDDLLLALLADEHSYAGTVLTRLGAPLASLRQLVQEGLSGDGAAGTHLTFSEGSREVLDNAYREAVALKYGQIGTEHLLLGLLGVHGGRPARCLREVGVTYDSVLEVVRQLYADETEQPAI
ncbi:MAG TPA: Clp protease N-terminal domain-containing protein, partial [bacterium]|nr:Clp protease N-terminal domain-containing protein [bacterium]